MHGLNFVNSKNFTFTVVLINCQNWPVFQKYKCILQYKIKRTNKVYITGLILEN